MQPEYSDHPERIFLTLRDLLAAHALGGILASKYFVEHCDGSGVGGGRENQAAIRAYQLADAMLKVRGGK